MAAEPRVYVWASMDTPGEPPDRLEVTTCSVCRALVPTVALPDHRAWHRKN